MSTKSFLLIPKGTAHSSAYHKIDGYRKLFETDSRLKEFKYHKSGAGTGATPKESTPFSSACITVRLLMFNADNEALDLYKRFWTDSPADIFKRKANC